MSLLDGLPRDALLETVMQQNIHVAIRSDAPSGATVPIGRGTAENPYGGRANESAWFDALLSDSTKTPAGATILLGPGTFNTQGNTGPAETGGLLETGGA